LRRSARVEAPRPRRHYFFSGLTAPQCLPSRHRTRPPQAEQERRSHGRAKGDAPSDRRQDRDHSRRVAGNELEDVEQYANLAPLCANLWTASRHRSQGRSASRTPRSLRKSRPGPSLERVVSRARGPIRTCPRQTQS